MKIGCEKQKKNPQNNCKIKLNVNSWDKQYYFKTLIEKVIT